MENAFKPLQIGGVRLENNLFLAPLAGFTDVAYRRLCKDFGAGLTVTEMVSVKGLCYNNVNTAALLQTAQNETPSCAQLFGSEPDFFVRALRLPALAPFDIIDINMGCPMPKVTKNGDGSALLSDEKTAAAVVEAVARQGRPVTVKIRIGLNDTSINAVRFARTLENSGARLVTVHGRTVKQLYGGQADWDIIGNVAAALNIPVIGNGDISSQDDAAKKILTYKTAGAMIGRGAIGNPQIFSLKNLMTDPSNGANTANNPLKPQKSDLESSTAISSDTRSFLLATVKRHIDYMLLYFSERYTVTNMRKHLPYYLKGVRGLKELRQKINHSESVSGLLDLLENALK